MRRRPCSQPSEQEEAASGWQTIYCSLSLIIVVLFVMLVSYSVADRNKMSHVRGALGAKAGRGVTVGVEKGAADSTGAEAAKEAALVSSAMLSLRKAGEDTGLKNEIAVERFLGGAKIRLNSDAVFPEGSAAIDKKMRLFLDEMGRVAMERNLSMKVQGHTDDVPVRTGEFPTNWELSAARAANVVRYLIGERGVPARRLTAEGFSQYRPLASNGSPEGRRKNRRIEIVLCHERDEEPSKVGGK
jgi:chemotaxis protein MotB